MCTSLATARHCGCMLLFAAWGDRWFEREIKREKGCLFVGFQGWCCGCAACGGLWPLTTSGQPWHAVTSLWEMVLCCFSVGIFVWYFKLNSSRILKLDSAKNVSLSSNLHEVQPLTSSIRDSRLITSSSLSSSPSKYFTSRARVNTTRLSLAHIHP
jgi:hypothetical protein